MEDSPTITGDPLVWRIQNWLQETFSGTTGYVDIDRDGITGANTVHALLRAFQIRLGISNTSTNFGNATSAAFTNRFGSGIQVQSEQDQTDPTKGDDIYTIVLGALWCKGYSTGTYTIDNHYTTGMGNAVSVLKTDAGCNQISSLITLNIMKALLSMDQFKKVPSGSDNLRALQQSLNYIYESQIGLIPCDGVYSRQMNKALIKILQLIEGFTGNNVDGIFGNGTKANLPIIPSSGQITPEKEKQAIRLINTALCCNGYEYLIEIDDIWTTSLENTLMNFQADMCLADTGVCNVDTWMALLLSKGNPDRSCTACDTRFEMTQSRINYLINHNYEVVGRYLTGGDFKELRVGEPKRIIDNNLQLFLIFQESGSNLSYFTPARGIQDAKKAVKYARSHGIPGNNIIYFAVDTDPNDTEIETYILPYFQAIHNNISKYYNVGVYGTRNVCTTVMNHNYAQTCFVSDMSTGYSGNMGFRMPTNWNLDQFSEISGIHTSQSEPDIDLDKVAYSGKYNTVSNIYSTISTFNNYIRDLEDLYRTYKINKSGSCTAMQDILGVTNFLRSFKYGNVQWYVATLTPINTEFIQYVQMQDIDLYNNLSEYANTDSKALADTYGGYIDIGHLAATIEGYLTSTLVSDFWFGWGGDLATLMTEVDNATSGLEYGDFLANARALLANPSSFGFMDVCSDADAIKLAQLMQNASSLQPFADTLNDYYTTYVSSRISFYLLDLNTSLSVEDLKPIIINKMTSCFENTVILGVLGTVPSVLSLSACAQAFAEYIVDNYPTI